MSAAPRTIGLFGLLRWRLRAAWNSLRQLREHSRLKMFIIVVAGAAIWLSIFLITRRGLTLMDRHDYSGAVKAAVIDFMLSSFFLALLVLLTFSNGVIAFGALFRNRETAFLASTPVGPGPLFTYRLTEGIVFSSWAFLFLGMPIILALGQNLGAPWAFYPGALLYFGAFALIPAALGGMIALAVARWFGQSPRRFLVGAAVVALLLGAVWMGALARDASFGATRGMEAWVSNVLGRLSFTKNPFLPSFWVAEGMGAMSRAEWGRAGRYFELVAANGLFLAAAAYWLAAAAYPCAYQATQAAGRRKRQYADNWLDRALRRALVGVPLPVRLLIVKDVKTFRRDAAQWSQVSIFFGLLTLYLLNIRRFRYDALTDEMRNMVSFLNLGATALTLSTFTTRFIFPMLSLEGRNFWTLALLPLERRRVLHGKFLFSFGGSLLISQFLILLSGVMLRTPWAMVALHAYIVLVVCAGLSGLAVGLGALYPNLREENPSKIVSGFGGSLNLMISMFFLVAIIALFAVPSHLAFLSGAVAEWLRAYLLVAGVLSAAAGLAAVWLPLWLGGRAFERLEG